MKKKKKKQIEEEEKQLAEYIDDNKIKSKSNLN